MKKLCLFCGKSHKTKRPELCLAKAEVINSYTKTMEFWKIMHGVESGVIDLDGEALRLVAYKKGNKL